MLRVERVLQPKLFLAAMILLQALWLTSTWLTTPTIAAWHFLLLLLIAIVVGVAIIRLSLRPLSKLRELGQQLLKNEKYLLLTLGLLVFIAGGIQINLNFPTSDELGSFEAARIVAEEGVVKYFADYSRLGWLGTQHPPLLPLLNGYVMRVVGVNFLVTRLISLLVSYGTVILTYLLGKALYDQRTGLLAALLLISFPIFFELGTMANNDMLVTFFFTLALLLTWHLLDAPNPRPSAQTIALSVLLGIAIGAGLLSKYTMILIFPVLLSTFVIKPPSKKLILRAAGGMIPLMALLATWLFYADETGLLATQSAQLLEYVGLVAKTDYGKNLLVSTLSVTLPSALGAYHIPAFLVGGWQLMRRRSQADLFILLCIAGVFLPVLLTLPIHRYMLPAFPALAILIACALQQIPKATSRATILALLYCAQVLFVYALITWLFRISRGW